MVSHAVWKTWPSGLSYDKNLGLRPRFLSIESLGPWFSHGMGDHDQILQHKQLAVLQNTVPWWYHAAKILSILLAHSINININDKWYTVLCYALQTLRLKQNGQYSAYNILLTFFKDCFASKFGTEQICMNNSKNINNAIIFAYGFWPTELVYHELNDSSHYM